MSELILAIALIVALPINGEAQRKRALMVGISDYRSNGFKVWGNIHGAEDVALLTPTLQEKGFQVQTLTNGQATYQGIREGLGSFIATSEAGDIAYLHFSCHGQPVEDGLNGMAKDEKDGWDESLVPIDAGKTYHAGYQGEKHLTDDELNGYISRLRRRIGPAGMLVVVVDACHAGTMSKGGLETIRGTDEALTSHPGRRYRPPKDHVRHYSLEKGPGLAPALFVEACKSFQRNTEIWVDGREYGALSYNVCQALRAMATFDATTREQFKAGIEASKKIRGRWPKTQTLVVEE